MEETLTIAKTDVILPAPQSQSEDVPPESTEKEVDSVFPYLELKMGDTQALWSFLTRKKKSNFIYDFLLKHCINGPEIFSQYDFDLAARDALLLLYVIGDENFNSFKELSPTKLLARAYMLSLNWPRVRDGEPDYASLDLDVCWSVDHDSRKDSPDAMAFDLAFHISAGNSAISFRLEQDAQVADCRIPRTLKWPFLLTVRG